MDISSQCTCAGCHLGVEHEATGLQGGWTTVKAKNELEVYVGKLQPGEARHPESTYTRVCQCRQVACCEVPSALVPTALRFPVARHAGYGHTCKCKPTTPSLQRFEVKYDCCPLLITCKHGFYIWLHLFRPQPPSCDWATVTASFTSTPLIAHRFQSYQVQGDLLLPLSQVGISWEVPSNVSRSPRCRGVS